MSEQTPKAARPHAELVRQAMDHSTPKTEREHALVREIEMLRGALEGVPQIKDGHTPGPWHISKHRDGRDMLVYDADGFEIARVCYPNRDANAALIAAAPCLVAALDDARKEGRRQGLTEAVEVCKSLSNFYWQKCNCTDDYMPGTYACGAYECAEECILEIQKLLNTPTEDPNADHDADEFAECERQISTGGF